MPETLPTPEKSIKEVKKDELQKIGNKQKLLKLLQIDNISPFGVNTKIVKK